MNKSIDNVQKKKTLSFPNDSVKNLCLSCGVLQNVKKNTVFLNEDTLNGKPYVYYLVDGICSICGHSTEGQEQTFLYQMPGDIIGHVPYLMPHGAYSVLYSYQRPIVLAKTNCTVYKIPAPDFLKLCETDVQFSNYLLKRLAFNYDMVISHLKQIQEEPSAVVLCRFLLRMADKTSKGLIVPKLFTHKEISGYFGIHDITVSRMMGSLKKLGYIDRVPEGLLIVDKEALQSIVMNQDSFKY
ncbi:MAG: Crp/Fnr family transcriptional regulator [Lachnospiraceae bacterium]|nr:Crp/Fnr family transcriptional regulator [Lachnospiraceae bacterium]